MNTAVLLAAAALAASVIMLQLKARLYPVLAVVVCGVQLVMALGVVSVRVKGLALPLVFGIALFVVGGLALWKASSKSVIAASTVVAFIGALQVIGALKLV